MVRVKQRDETSLVSTHCWGVPRWGTCYLFTPIRFQHSNHIAMLGLEVPFRLYSILYNKHSFNRKIPSSCQVEHWLRLRIFGERPDEDFLTRCCSLHLNVGFKKDEAFEKLGLSFTWSLMAQKTPTFAPLPASNLGKIQNN